MPPLLSELTAGTPLKIHALCHFLAIVICSLGIVLDDARVVRAGAFAGFVGAVAFLVFAIAVFRKLQNWSKKRPARRSS